MSVIYRYNNVIWYLHVLYAELSFSKMCSNETCFYKDNINLVEMRHNINHPVSLTDHFLNLLCTDNWTYMFSHLPVQPCAILSHTISDVWQIVDKFQACETKKNENSYTQLTTLPFSAVFPIIFSLNLRRFLTALLWLPNGLSVVSTEDTHPLRKYYI